jgi:glycosyltransferase involved in cell wall biosynthesis
MRFSIITVVLNDIQNIEKTILSLKNQTYKNYEHIIIDGKSSDGTIELIKRYSKTARLYVKKDKSLYEAINRGVKKSNGEIIFLIHSGDIFGDKNILKKVNRIFKKKYDILSGNIQFYKAEEAKIVRDWSIKLNKFNSTNFFKVPHTSLFIKKNLFNKIKNYSTNYKISSDLDFLIKLSKLKSNFYYFNQNIIYMQTGGLSTSIDKMIQRYKEDIKILYKHFGLFFLFMFILKISNKFKGFLKLNKFNNKKLRNQLNSISQKKFKYDKF